jgi:enoyl-[acyl-carrier protein] reductase I
LAAELGPKGIRAHAISPGPLATRAASGIPEFDKLLEKAKAKAPARSLVSIEDVGAATAFLVRDAARAIAEELRGNGVKHDGKYAKPSFTIVNELDESAIRLGASA